MQTPFKLAALGCALTLALGAQEHRSVTIKREAVGGENVTWFARSGPTVAIHDAGIRFEGRHTTGAPYSAEVVTETSQTLADGNKIRRENRSKVHRDSQGRIRREETLNAVGPWATGGDSKKTIFINDPVSNTHYVLDPENKTARKMNMPSFDDHFVRVELDHDGNGSSSSSSSSQTFEMHVEKQVEVHVEPDGDRTAPAAFVPQSRMAVAGFNTALDMGETLTEPLGTKMIEGVQATGTRNTIVIPADQIGADRDVEIVDERWFSEELGVDLLTRHSDPRSGETVYRLTNIQLGEQPLTLFEPPADYELVEGNPFFGDPGLHH